MRGTQSKERHTSAHSMAESLQAGGKGDRCGEDRFEWFGDWDREGGLVAEVSLSVLAVIFPVSPITFASSANPSSLHHLAVSCCSSSVSVRGHQTQLSSSLEKSPQGLVEISRSCDSCLIASLVDLKGPFLASGC